MVHFGNVVPLPERQSSVPRQAPARRRIKVGRMSYLEQTFCAVPFADLIVKQGVMHGEALETCADFIVGDTFAVHHDWGVLAANDHRHAPKPANAIKADCAAIRALADWAKVVRMALLDETGCGYQAYAVAPAHNGMRPPYVLLPRDLPIKRKLTLIKVTAL